MTYVQALEKSKRPTEPLDEKSNFKYSSSQVKSSQVKLTKPVSYNFVMQMTSLRTQQPHERREPSDSVD